MTLSIHKDKQSDGSIIFKLGHNAVDAKTTMGYKTEADAQAALENITGPAVLSKARQVVEETVTGNSTTITGDQV